MKKLSRWQRERHIRIATLRARRKRKRRIHCEIEAHQNFGGIDHIMAPERIDITGRSGLELRAFIDRLSDVVRAGDIAKVNFRNTEIMYPAAAILLFAEIDRIVSTASLSKPIKILHSKSQRVREVLKQIGLYDLTGDPCETVPSRKDVIFWKSVKGRDQTGDNLSTIEVVAQTVKLEHGADLVIDSLWRGVTEAVSNSVEHAHKQPRSDGFLGLKDTKWWTFTQVKDNVFTVVVCDLGCGYRATIGQTLDERFLSGFKSFIGVGNEDAHAIEAAMEFGRTGTRESNRGKGSRDALHVLEKHQDGELVIFSNTGRVGYKFSGGRPIVKRSAGLGFSIEGTILWWKLPLKVAQNDGS